MAESENSLTSSEEPEEEVSSSGEGSEESTSGDSIEQRIMPSRTNRGSRMRFLLSNARLIAESRADKGYKRLFSDGETSDSMNDSEEYSSESNTSSDSFDSDFDDEAKGKLPLNLPSSDSSSDEDGMRKRRIRKMPKRFRSGRPQVLGKGEACSEDPVVESTNLKPSAISVNKMEIPEETIGRRPARGLKAVPFSAVESSPNQGGIIARAEKKVELLAERRARVSSIARKSPVEDATLEKKKRKVPVNSTLSLTQEERMQSAMRMREHNLAVLASESALNEDEATVTQNTKRSLREKWPFYFYEPSGYRRIEKAEWVEKYGTTTLYIFPMCSKEYMTLFSTSMTQSTSEVAALSHRRLECSIDTNTGPHNGSLPSKYKYHYSQEHASHISESPDLLSSKYLVPYPLRFGDQTEKPLKPTKHAGMFAKDGKITFGQKSPNSGLLGCKGPYREPFTGLFYATPAQYNEIIVALQRIREFWRIKGYPQEWASIWGDLDEVNTHRSLRWELMPFLVEVVRQMSNK